MTTSGAAAVADLHREADVGTAYDARLIRRLWVFIRPYRAWFWAAMACLPLTSACSLAQPYLLKIAIDRSIANADRGGLLRVALLYGLAMVGEFAFVYLQYVLMMVVAQRSLADLRLASKTPKSTSLGTVLKADTTLAFGTFLASASAPEDLWAMTSSMLSSFIGREQVT